MRKELSLFICLSSFSFLIPISLATRTTPFEHVPSPVKAVNLGGWLVTEGWLSPDLFNNIPVNKDLLDGTQIQLKSVKLNKYLSAQHGGGSKITANQPSASARETFKLWRITETRFQFRAKKWQFFGLSGEDKLVAISTSSSNFDSSHTFEIIRNYNEPKHIRIKAPNGRFLQVKHDMSVTADYQKNSTWGNDDASVFMITIVEQLKGEFQVTNGYGSQKVESVMKNHWNNFIVEDDFKFISENGLTAIRIPVGWWIQFDPNPPHPFVGGSLQALDNAFAWAEKYNLKVILDLHAAPGSQNGWDHSGTRDGLQSWGQSDDTINQSIGVIKFLVSRYSNRSSLYAVELINEPLAPGVTLDKLKKYYKTGYNVIRNYCNAFVIMSNRLGINNSIELIEFASGFTKSVVDVHYYNFVASIFQGMSVQQNIDYVYNERASDLRSLMVPNGPLIFVGEWGDEMEVKNTTKKDYQRFGSAQLDVFGRKTFGWSYWTLKAVDNHWSLEWMIKNEYMKV